MAFWSRRTNLVLQFLLFCVLTLLQHTVVSARDIGDACKILDQPGVCRKGSDCIILQRLYLPNEIKNHDVPSCGTTEYEEIICCPTNRFQVPTTVDIKTVSQWSESTSPTTTSNKPKAISSKIDTDDRPALRACREYDEYARSLGPPLVSHILNGIPAEFGEFPHMAAIGYRSETGNDQSDKLEYTCGATLIAPRFVITAAHCVAKKGLNPVVVRLNFTDFKDDYQRFIEIPITSIRFPDTYRIGKIYDDIAVIELERDVPKSRYCHPTCLYTEKEPAEDLYATGWGVTQEKKQSSRLLKISLKIQPLDACNDSFNIVPSRRYSKGIIESQLCAYDPETDERKKGDTCHGDSGGPLVEVVDESLRIYRTVGVVSSGFHCGTQTSGLYTRVSAYLNFIEDIVWPQK